jgi:exonuclease SbcD
MRILHTSDLHIGRTLSNISLLEDQETILNQIADIARNEGVDVVVIAGDIYDRAAPSGEAVAVVDRFLVRLVVHDNRKVLAIAGNHDSPERIGFTARILQELGLHLRGPLDDLSPIVIDDAHGPVAFHLLPYAEVAVARHHALGVDTTDPTPEAANADAALNNEGTDTDTDTIRDHQAAMNHLVRSSLAVGPDVPRRVAVAHAFITGGAISDTERDLSVGGASQVAAETFDAFAYVALGHLHRAQAIGSGRVRYSGSPLKYSLKEVDHAKSVAIVDIDADGSVEVRTVPLAPKRDVRIIKGTIDDLLKAAPSDGRCHDLVGVQLTDKFTVVEPAQRLGKWYPHIIGIEYVDLATGPGAGAGSVDTRRSALDLFTDFFKDMTGTDLDEADVQVVATAIRTAETRLEEVH